MAPRTKVETTQGTSTSTGVSKAKAPKMVVDAPKTEPVVKAAPAAPEKPVTPAKPAVKVVSAAPVASEKPAASEKLTASEKPAATVQTKPTATAPKPSSAPKPTVATPTASTKSKPADKPAGHAAPASAGAATSKPKPKVTARVSYEEPPAPALAADAGTGAADAAAGEARQSKGIPNIGGSVSGWVHKTFPHHENAFWGGVIALVIALLVFVIGLLRMLFVCLLVVVGVAVGQLLDGDPKIIRMVRSLFDNDLDRR